MENYTGHFGKDTYMIVRYFRKENKSNKIMQRGLTLEQAQEHCNDPKTAKAYEWFDGYNKE